MHSTRSSCALTQNAANPGDVSPDGSGTKEPEVALKCGFSIGPGCFIERPFSFVSHGARGFMIANNACKVFFSLDVQHWHHEIQQPDIINHWIQVIRIQTFESNPYCFCAHFA